MKILIVQQCIPSYRVPFFNKLSALPDYEITLIVAKNPEMTDSATNITDKKEYHFPIYWLLQKRLFGRYVYFPELRHYIRKECPQVLITQNRYFPGYFLHLPTFFTLKMAGTKLVYWTIPTKSPTSVICSFFTSVALSFADAFLVYGEHGIEVLKHLGVKKKSIFIAYNSIDTDVVLRIKEEVKKHHTPSVKKMKRIIFMGRFIPEKHVDFLIHAFKYVVKHIPSAQLFLMGDGPERHTFERLADDLGLSGSVVFLGDIRDDFVKAPYLFSSSLFVLPGMGGLAINEAACYELPIICAKGDGTESQLVIDGVNGYFFKESDNRDLAKKILTILSNENLQQQMGARSLEIILKKVNIHTMLSGFQNAISYVTRT